MPESSGETNLTAVKQMTGELLNLNKKYETFWVFVYFWKDGDDNFFVFLTLQAQIQHPKQLSRNISSRMVYVYTVLCPSFYLKSLENWPYSDWKNGHN